MGQTKTNKYGHVKANSKFGHKDVVLTPHSKIRAENLYSVFTTQNDCIDRKLFSVVKFISKCSSNFHFHLRSLSFDNKCSMPEFADMINQNL